MSDRPKVIKVKVKKSTTTGCLYFNTDEIPVPVQTYFLYLNTILKRSQLIETELQKITTIEFNYEFVPETTENKKLEFTVDELIAKPSGSDDYFFELKVSLPECDVDKFRENSPRLCQIEVKYGTEDPENFIIPLVNDF